MAIASLYKMTLYGAESQKLQVLEQLQALACVHLVDLEQSALRDVASDVASDTREALKYLTACPERLRQVRRSDAFHLPAVVASALRLRDEQQKLGDERDELRKAIKDLEPWGEFRLPADGKIGDVRIRFYLVPLRRLQQVDASAGTWQVIARDRAAHRVCRSAQSG